MSAWLLVALLLVAYAWSQLRSTGTRAAAPTRLRLDATGIEYDCDDCVRRAEWKDVTEVRIRTTDEGPYVEDVFFGIHTGSGSTPQVVVPHEDAVRGKLLEELQRRLPGLDDRAVVEAMGCCARRTFVIWRRPADAAASRSG